MTGRLRLLDTGERPPRWNAAASAALLASAETGGSACLRFHAFPPACVLGRFQDSAVELDLPACEAREVAIARRTTGGGAVVMGPGALAWDLLLPTRVADPHAVARLAGQALVAVLAGFGVAAVQAMTGTIEVGRRKVSGSAGRLGRRALLHQATLIVDLARVAPLALLRRRTEGGRPTPDPTHRVTSLRDELTVVPAADMLRAELAAALAAAFNLELCPDGMKAVEIEWTDALLRDRFGRDDFALTGDVEARAA